MLDGVGTAANLAREKLTGIKDVIQSKRGALEHVGGQVAKERAEIAQKPCTLARAGA